MSTKRKKVSARNEASLVDLCLTMMHLETHMETKTSEVSRSMGIQANEAVRRDSRLTSQSGEWMLLL